MSCGCNNFESIGSCAPFANREDVIAALTSIDSACCVGEVVTATALPCSSDNAAQAAVLEAFPNGIVNCNCPCVFLVDNTNNSLSMNCSGDLTQASNWMCMNHDDCIGHLTTVGLDPSADDAGVSAAAGVAEAWDLGFPVQCENAIMIREDGTFCYTIDTGVTWNCGASAAAAGGAFTAGSGNISGAGERVCPGGCVGVGADCDSVLDRSRPMTLFTVNFETDFAASTNDLLGDGTILQNCVICDFTGVTFLSAAGVLRAANQPNLLAIVPTADGFYKIDFTVDYTGNFSQGSAGCAGCTLSGTTDGTMELVDRNDNVLISWQLLGNRGISDKDNIMHRYESVVPLVFGEEYLIRLTSESIPAACCLCAPAFDVRSQVFIKNWGMTFLG